MTVKKISDLRILVSGDIDREQVEYELMKMLNLTEIKVEADDDTGIMRHAFHIPFMDSGRFRTIISLGAILYLFERSGGYEYTVICCTREIVDPD